MREEAFENSWPISWNHENMNSARAESERNILQKESSLFLYTPAMDLIFGLTMAIP